MKGFSIISSKTEIAMEKPYKVLFGEIEVNYYCCLKTSESFLLNIMSSGSSSMYFPQLQSVKMITEKKAKVKLQEQA